MNRTISIPAADNALLEMLAQKMGWEISPKKMRLFTSLM